MGFSEFESMSAFIGVYVVFIILSYVILLAVRLSIDRWAAKGTAYGVTSFFQMILVLTGTFSISTSLISLSAKEPLTCIIGFATAANSFFVAVVICFIYEKATGVSLLTGKVVDEELAERVKAGRGRAGELVEPPPPEPKPEKKWPWKKPEAGRWTAKAAVCLVLAAAFALIAYVTSNELMYFPAIACVVALLLDYVSCLLSFRRLRYITLSRDLPEYAGEDDLIEIKLTLDNPGKELNHIILVDSFPAESPSQRQRKIAIDYLPERSNETFSYHAICYRRGVYDVGPVEVRREFPLGLFRNRLVFEEFTRIKIYPHLFHISDFTLHFGGAKQRIGLSTIEKAGLSNDFFGVREYVPGDSKRLIHWKSTAKRGTLIVKELEKPADFDLTALIDLNITASAGIEKYNTFEYSIKIVGSLARLVLQKGYDMRLLALGDGRRELYLNKGMQDFPLVLDYLASLKQKRTMPIDEAIRYIYDNLRQETTLLLPLQDPHPGIVSILLMLRNKNIETRVFLFDLSTFTFNGERKQNYLEIFNLTAAMLSSNNFVVYPIRYEDGPVGSLLGGFSS